MRLALPTLLSLLLLAAPAAAQEDAVTPAELERVLDSAWYGVYGADGQKIGWAYQLYGRVGEGAEAVYRSETRFEMKLVTLGERLLLERTDEQVYDGRPPYALRSARVLNRQDEDEAEETLTREGEEMLVVTRAGGEEQRRRIPAVAIGFADEVAGALWLARGPEVGQKARYLSFDLEELDSSWEEIELLGTRELRIEGVRTRVHEVRVEDERQGPLGTGVHDVAGRLLSAKLQGLFELRREPEALARRTDWGADLFVQGSAKVDRPLGEPEGIKRLVLRALGEGVAALRDGPGQQVSAVEAASCLLTIDPSRQVAAPEAPSADALSEEARARYLRVTPQVPADHPELIALARRATGDAASPREKVERLVRFVSDYVEDAYGADAISVLDVVRRKRGDCTEHAALFTTLARAAGIPCREVSGLAYLGDEVQAFGGHAWNEVFVEGRWLPVDPTWNEVVLSATHVRLGDEDQDRTGLALGRLRFELVEVGRGE